MKIHWSSLSTPDCYENDLTDENLTPYQIKDEHGNEIGCDKWENIYGTRSTVNAETLKKKHILFLGDSFVYGHGVARGNTVTDYVEKLVSDEYSCFNLGVPGTGVDTALLRLQQWCNMFGEQVHTIYFGISELSRTRHYESIRENWVWEDEVYRKSELNSFCNTMSLNYSPAFGPGNSFSHPYLIQREKTIIQGYNSTLSKVNSVAKLDATVMAVINLSKAYNFNVYFFSTNSSNLPDEDEKVLKEQTENYNIKWCTGTHLDPVMITFEKHKTTSKEWETYYIKNDGHWNVKGNNMIASVLYEETKHWY